MQAIHLSRFVPVLAVCTMLLAVGAPQSVAAQAAASSDDLPSRLEAMERHLQHPDRRDAMTEDEWHAYSRAILQALAADDIAQQEPAMRMIIMYGDRLDVEQGIFDLARIFQSHPDWGMRHLAAATLGAIGSDVGISMLARLAQDEKVQQVRTTAQNIVRQYNERRASAPSHALGAAEDTAS